MILSEELAQDIVRRSMDIIHHNVNVISKSGIIIASGDKARIGRMHDVARDVARSGKRINVYAEDLTYGKNYAPGINAPITINGKVLFVVGVTGNPNEITRYAELAFLTAELLAKLAFENRLHRFSTRRNDIYIERILREYRFPLSISSSVPELDAVRLNVDADNPRVPVVLKFELLTCGSKSAIEDLLLLDAVDDCIDSNDFGMFASDIYYFLPPQNRTESLLQALQEWQHQLTAQGAFIGIAVGLPASDKLNLINSMQFTLYCVRHCDFSIRPLCRASDAGGLTELILKDNEVSFMLDSLQLGFNDLVHDEKILNSLNVFFACNLEINRTAQALQIHRNSLRYRFKKIENMTGLNPFKFEHAVILYLMLRHQMLSQP